MDRYLGIGLGDNELYYLRDIEIMDNGKKYAIVYWSHGSELISFDINAADAEICDYLSNDWIHVN